MNTDRFVRFWICFVIFFGFVMPFLSTFFSYSSEESTGFNDYARIVGLDYKAELVDEPGNGGNVVITEQITYDVHAASSNNLFWELWRDLPEDYVDGLKVDYTVNYVKQLNDDGTEIVYQESPKLYWDDSDYTSSLYGPYHWYHSEGPYSESAAQYEAVFFYVDGIYRDQVTFEIQYEMHNAALKYSDVSELYLTMYSEDSVKYLESFSGQILIPNEDMPRSGNYLAHTFGTNANSFPYTESDTVNPGYHTFSFQLDQDDLKFKSYNEYLEFTLLSFNEDRHIFTDYAPDNYYSDDVYLEEAMDAIREYDELPLKAKEQKLQLLAGAILLSVIFFGYVIIRNQRIQKKHQFYQPSQNILYYRDIPSDLDPYFAASLVFAKKKGKIDEGDAYSAIMLSLVRKGYIELEKISPEKDWKNNNIQLRVLYQPIIIPTGPAATLNDLINASYQNSVKPEIDAFVNNSLLHTISPSAGETQPGTTTETVTADEERINIHGKKLEPLSMNEQTYYNLIRKYAKDGTISMKQFENQVANDYDSTDTFLTSIQNSVVNIGISNGYFQKADYLGLKKEANSLAKIYIILAILLMTIGNLIISMTRLDLAFGAFFILGITLIICALIVRHDAKKYVLFTQLGEDEYTKWYALYNFLNSNTLMKEKTVVELPLWEEYLVYATAFGISEKVIKALEIQRPDISASPMLSNRYYYTRSFVHFGHSFRSSAHHASSVSRSYHSSGGSFYGGGGRGGGGGGGGH